MNERPDTYLTPDQRAAAQHRHFLVEQIRRLRVLQGNPNPSPTGLVLDAERAAKLWKRIPSDKLAWCIDKARDVHGTANVTLEKVAATWLKRDQKQKPSEEERYRRRMAAEARAEREAAPPEIRDQFFSEIHEALK